MSDLLDRLKEALSDRYAIDREIGRGGMAVVYLAEDLKHGRQVAIKVLQPSVSATLGTERFLKEIETAARLQHPHILPLYDSGESDGFLFYVMPYVEGESLRDRLDREGQLPVEEAIRLAREVADGLGYAHAEGVIHRDIKPGNLMLQGGHAVIADFGIAQAVDEAGGEKLTATGVSTGSPVYMSPEQARGVERLDGRTDLYSLGCVLYEMLAGEAPFTGGTRASITARKEMESAPDLGTLRNTVPEGVAAAVTKALAKVPADRFQGAGEFAEALDAPSSFRSRDAGSGRPDVNRKLVLISAVAVVALTLWIIAILAPGSQTEADLRIGTGKIVQVTSSPGVEFQPALSPDGSEVAYLSGSISEPKLGVRSAVEIGGGESLLATELSGLQLFPRWSSETAVRFVVCENPSMMGSPTRCAWREMGGRGGALRTVEAPRESSQYAWSRDGARAAFIIRDSLFAYRVADPRPRLLAVQGHGLWLPHSLAWSPDGKRVAYVRGNTGWLTSGNTAPTSIWVIDSQDGKAVQVTPEDHLNVSPQWLPDSRHLLFVSDRDGKRGIYSVEIGPDGPLAEPRVLAAATDAHSISISDDGTKLAYSEFLYRQNIWSLPVPVSGPVSTRDAEPVTVGTQIIEEVSISADGKWMAYDGKRRGNMDIYKQPLEGGSAQLLADDSAELFAPEWSPDGTEIALYGGRDTDVYLITADGTRQAIVTGPGFDNGPTWSPDGLALAYTSQGGDEEAGSSLWVVRRDSVGGTWGMPRQLTDFQCPFPDWSPDGQGIVCSDDFRAVIVSPGGKIMRRVDLSRDGFVEVWLFRFANDGSALYFGGRHEDGRAGIWSVPLNGGVPNLLVIDDPARPMHWWASCEFDGRFYFTLSEYESDIYVMDLEY